MHISEGVLSAPVLITGGLLTVIGTGIGLKKMDYDKVMTVSILAATFFVATLVHVPVGPASVHLVLTGLLGLILGWAAFPAIIVGLLMQAIFFQYGGLAVLGVNTFNMAFPALLCGFACRPFLKGTGRARSVAAFLGGSLAVLGSGLLVAVSLTFTDQGFVNAAGTILLAHLPIAAIEGILTVFVVSFVAKVQPDMLGLNSA